MKLSTAHKAQLSKVTRVALAGAMVVSSLGMSVVAPADAALTSNTTTVSDSRPGQATTTYTISFNPSASALGAINQVTVKFCTDASSFTGCAAPAGLDIHTDITSAASATGFGTGGGATAGSFVRVGANQFTFTPTSPSAEVAANAHVINLTGIMTNPSAAGTYYAMVRTYSDAGTTMIDSGTSAYAIVAKVDVTGRVAETMTFTVAGVANGATCGGENASVTSTDVSVPFGNFQSGTPRVACQTVSVATNAFNGYNAYVSHTNSGASPQGGMCRQTALNCTADGAASTTPTADTIVDAGLSSVAGSYAVGDFGVGVNANGAQAHTDFGGNTNFKSMFNADVAVAASTAPTNAVNTIVKLKADVPATQTAGVYQNSYQYTVIPNF